VRTGLLDWLDEPVAARGASFLEDDGTWRDEPYPGLAHGVHRVAGRLLDLPLGRDAVVAIVLPTCREFLTSFFGVLLAGGVPAPLVPPTLVLSRAGYVDQLAELLAASSAAAVVTNDDARPVVEQALARAHAAAAVIVEPFSSEPCELTTTPPRSDHALLQFTSGSSGRPRGVQVTWDNLEENTAMIRDWLRWAPDEPGTSWLPTYHDMGLVGCLMTPITYGRPVRFMRPEQFIRDPASYLRTFGTADPSVYTAGPNFGFAYLAKRIDPASLTGLDFSSWRTAIVGAERLDAAALGRFTSLLEPFGFPRTAIMPAYGLAEATLCVTASPAGRGARAVRPDWSALRFGGAVAIAESAPLGDERIGDAAGWLVSCGEPIAPAQVTVVDELGVELPPGCLGEVVVRGPTIADGYLDGARDGSTSFHGDSVATGDAGAILGDDLFVFGRLGDRVKVRGRVYHAEDLEGKVTALPGVPTGRCIVIPGVSEAESGVTVIIEAEPGPWMAAVRTLLRREIGQDAAVRIGLGRRGSILRTSSGKPRRRVMWQRLIEGSLPDELSWDADVARAT
jgi:acyl-CoA synthetase (AMP-forming)/AMP-acid ligase II